MKIGVVGLGLIGGSIFKALKKQGHNVIGVSQSQGNKFDDIYAEWEHLSDRELIFVCSPMNKVVSDLRKLENFVSENAIVTDVSSLKVFVSQEVFKYRFIPSHPMAGTEFSGYANSFDTLFVGAKWILTPTNTNVPTILTQIIEEMGAKILITTPEEHDEAVALISHMPLVLSQALFMSADTPVSKKLASSGFRDMTRLALSSEEMACDMVNMNSDNIQKALLKLYANIGNLIKENYPEKIHTIKQERKEMYKDGVNIL